jgi:hypothetical protein
MNGISMKWNKSLEKMIQTLNKFVTPSQRESIFMNIDTPAGTMMNSTKTMINAWKLKASLLIDTSAMSMLKFTMQISVKLMFSLR